MSQYAILNISIMPSNLVFSILSFLPLEEKAPIWGSGETSLKVQVRQPLFIYHRCKQQLNSFLEQKLSRQ